MVNDLVRIICDLEGFTLPKWGKNHIFFFLWSPSDTYGSGRTDVKRAVVSTGRRQIAAFSCVNWYCPENILDDIFTTAVNLAKFSKVACEL